MYKHIEQVKREMLKDWDKICKAVKERIKEQGHDIDIVLKDER